LVLSCFNDGLQERVILLFEIGLVVQAIGEV